MDFEMSAAPIPVLHVLGSLERGGVETWLLDLLHHLDWSHWRFDFCTLGPCCGRYAELARSRGSRVLACPLGEPRNLERAGVFLRRLHRLLRSGRYAVVHSHVHYFSAVVLSVARAAGVPVRVAHSHNSRDGQPDTWPRRLYRAASARLLAAASSWQLGCSVDAAEALFKTSHRTAARPGWRSHPPVDVLHYGLRDSFHSKPAPGDGAPAALRLELGLGGAAAVIGHVGRFERQKNHEFLLNVAAWTVCLDPAIRWLLVGEGCRKAEIEERANRMGLGGVVHFCGRREDVPALMTQAMDAFVLPSRHEGLPLALLEAQAAGLPSLVSSRITREAAVVQGAVEFLPLEAGAAIWAQQALSVLKRGRISRDIACRQMETGGFTAQRSLEGLLAIYRSALDSCRLRRVA